MLANQTKHSDIIIQNQQLLSWIQGMNDFEPNDLLTIRELTLKQFVINTWGIIPPCYLLDEDLQELMGIFPSIKSKVESEFEGSILNYYFQFSFDIADLTVKTLNIICSEANFINYKNICQQKSIKKILTHQKDIGLKKNKNFTLLIETFFESPEKFIKLISSYAVLQKYSNELKSRFLDGYIKELTNLSLKHFNPNIDFLPTDITSAIMVELNSLLNNAVSLEEIIEIIRCTSGLLEKEFNVLIKFVSSQMRFDSNMLIPVIRSHFNGLLLKQPLLLNSLEGLTSPPFPTQPDFTNPNEWFSWAEYEYLPYRRWQDGHKEKNEILDSYGALFSNWLAKNYLDLKFSYPRTVMNLLPTIKQQIDKQSLTLMLIIDNIGVRWNEYIIELFKRNNVDLLQRESFVAAIPTETRISKTALLSANYIYSKNEQDYRKLTEQITSEQFQNKQLFYTTKVSDLRQLPDNVDFVILNYLMIDDYMHMDQNKMASPRFEVISNELSGLINLICKSLNYRPEVDIYVMSDHGSVRIPNDNVVNLENIFLGDKILELTDRYICVSDSQLKRFRSKLEEIGYIFEKDRYDLDANYVIIKGYNSFKKTAADQYLHGGLSPEEVLVPLLHFHKSSHSFNRPNVYLRDNTFRFNVKTHLILAIENTNSSPINNLKLTILSPFVSADTDEVTVDKIESLSRIEIRIADIRILRKGTIHPSQLAIGLKFEIASHQYHYEVELPIAIKSMQENTFDFDEF